MNAVQCDPNLTTESRSQSVRQRIGDQQFESSDCNEAEIETTGFEARCRWENPDWIGDICANTLALEYLINANGQKVKNSTILIEELQPKETQTVKIKFLWIIQYHLFVV